MERQSPLEMNAAEFRKLGHELVDEIAEFLATLRDRRPGSAEDAATIRKALGHGLLPEQGSDPAQLLKEASNLLFDHSVLNGHPRFWGYITSSAAPIGALGDLLAAAVNPNLGGWAISPMATEIEVQTVRWIAEMLGYPAECGGLLVSGGNMANFVCFLAARAAKAHWNLRAGGFLQQDARRLRIYASAETHTWIQKAADMFGLGTDSIRWIPVDRRRRMDLSPLQNRIREDTGNGDLPFLCIGTAGSVSTGAIDPLQDLAAICREHSMWLHVDGAYGGFAAVLPDAPADLRALADADSVAIDPHKWLYAPLEAGCALVRNPEHLRNAFSYTPPYYHISHEGINYFEYGPQNSRGFRALKVWLGLRQVGRQGYIKMISDDIALARELNEGVKSHAELQAFTSDLSITTFRYVPTDLRTESQKHQEYLNRLNKEILTRLTQEGEVFLSNAVVDGNYLLRACIVNFRTTSADVQALPQIVVRTGKATDAEFRRED